CGCTSSLARRWVASTPISAARCSTHPAHPLPDFMRPVRWRASAAGVITATTLWKEPSSVAASSPAAMPGATRPPAPERTRMDGDIMTLTNQDIADPVAFRRELHQFPEISGEEVETARRVVAFLEDTRPDTVLAGLGGHGVAAVYDSGVPGPTVLFRSELDALPIEELSDAPHRSTIPGKSHMCGH